MIYKEFIENWNKIIAYNQRLDSKGQTINSKSKEYRFPLTSLKLKAQVVHYLMKTLYPLFINDQENVLDLIISENGEKIEEIIFHRTKQSGIYHSSEKLSNDFFKLKYNLFKNLDSFFNDIQEKLLKKKKLNISHLRIVNSSAVPIINEYGDKIKTYSFKEFLIEFAALFQKLIKENLFIIYPEPTIYNFLKKFFILLNNIDLASILKYIISLLPNFNFAVLLDSDDYPLVIEVIRSLGNEGNLNFDLKLLGLDDLSLNSTALDRKNLLKEINEKLNVDYSYYVQQNQILNFLSDIFEVEVLTNKEKLKLLIEKFLYGIRSYEKVWFKIPKPFSYNTLLRFFVRIFGFQINLRKLSHWEISDFLFNTLDFYFGAEYKLLIIIKDLDLSNQKPSKKNSDSLKSTIKYTILFNVHNQSTRIIKLINNNEIPSDLSNLPEIRNELSKKYGYINYIIQIDESLIRSIIKNYIFELTSIKAFAKIKVIRRLKNDLYFKMFPELPPYKLLKEKGTLSLVRTFLPIFIDKHQF
ncbi:MAG: hypothetical protein GF317_00210 [Candidatus Lokiarchaeota archaeon]|nr:hypothetical protein [Candidatus Lokiarchaeota archaeon]MBD3198405.1 hypothetical protein [Candidatus Lokiarchaeota archaeon]